MSKNRPFFQNIYVFIDCRFKRECYREILLSLVLLTNEVMLPIIEATPPPSIKGKYIKIKYCMQLPGTYVPSFVFYANLPQYVREPYRRFLENQIREHWDFKGTPINVYIRQK